MVCSRCGKSSAGKFHTVENGRGETRVLCSACYELLYGDKVEKEFFDSLFGKTGELPVETGATCPSCGTTMEDFRKSGLLGCAKCYEALRAELTPAIRRIQGRVQHAGRAPVGDAGNKFSRIRALVDEREDLKEEMERAMRAGDYALANRLKERLIAINRTLYQGEDS